MAIVNKKSRLAGLLSGLGITQLVSWLPRRPQLIAFNYHRIGSVEGNAFDDAVFSATPEDLRAQLLFIQKHFDLPPLTDLITAAVNGFQFKRPTALITFDDGYRDNYKLALPVLKDCGVPAVFFIPTDFVDRPRLPWWDRIAYIIKKSGAEVLELDIPERIVFDLRTTPRRLVVKRVLDLFKRHVGRGESEFLAHLEQKAYISLPPELASYRWIVTWDEIRAMIAAGMAIGSHTHTHGILGGMDEETQAYELRESKAILERETGQAITTIAYPVGSKTAFTETTKRLAKEAGYQLAFSYHGGINWAGQIDPFDVHRIGVEADESSSLFRTRTIFNSVFGKSF